MLASLAPAARAKSEAWMGSRPTLTPTHRPARPSMF
jgi:hypothetical protein